MTAVIVGDRARLPSGLDLTGNRNAQAFSGRAWGTDGTGDYLSLGSPSDLDGFFNTGGTFTGWFNVATSSHYEKIFDFGTATTLSLQADMSGYIFTKDWSTTDGSWTYNGGGGASHGMWFHLVLSYNASSTGNDPALYINGVLQTIDGETTPVGSAVADTSNKFLGIYNDGSSNPYDGEMADIKFITSTVTAAQALEMYQNPEQVLPTGISSSALKCWLPLCDYDIAADTTVGGLYFQDASGNGNHALSTNGAMSFGHPVAPQLGLRSSSSRVLVNNVSGKQASATLQSAPGTTFTVACWFMEMANDDTNIIWRMGGTTATDDDFLELYLNSSGQLQVYGDGSVTAGSPAIGEWHHVVVVSDGSSPYCKVYVDNSEISTSGALGQAADISTATLIIGDQAPTLTAFPFDGVISEIAVWDSVLTSGNVSTLWNSGVQGADANAVDGGNLLNWYKCDNNVSLTNLSDNSTNVATYAAADQNMVTVPEGSTADLSSFGTLTTPRQGSGVFCIPPQRSVTGKLGGVLTSPQVAFGTQNWTMGCWVKSSGYTDSYQAIWQFRPGNDRGPRCYITSATAIQMDYGGATTTDTVSMTVSSLMGNWTFVVLQRLAAASFKGWARKISDSSWTSQAEAVDVGDMTDPDSGVCGWGYRADNDAYNLNGPLAFPRIWLHGSDTPWVEAELNAIFEQGKRFLVGDS